MISFKHIIFYTCFIVFLKNIHDIQCLYVEKFISNNSSSKSYSSNNPPSAVYRGKSVFDSNDDATITDLSTYGNNDEKVGWAVPDSIEYIMARQCGNTESDYLAMSTCVRSLGYNDRALCIHCKQVKVVKQFYRGIWVSCRLEAECYNEQCELVRSALETYASYISNYVKINSYGVIKDTDYNNHDWAPLAEVCEGIDYRDGYVDDFTITFKNDTS